MQHVCKGMRKGGETVVAGDRVKGIPVGLYSVQVDEATGNGTFEMKQFELEVFDAGCNCGGLVRRLV